MNNDIVEPKQQRSIEKRNKILNSGFNLFLEKGYYHTTTTEIAKQAGVSTGIVYRYFPDKKAIFIEGMRNFNRNTFSSYIEMIKGCDTKLSLKDYISKTIDYMISCHNMSKAVFEELDALSHYDTDVSLMVNDVKEKAIGLITDYLPSIDLNIAHPHEKIHIIWSIIETYCHEIVYNQESCKDYNYLKDLIISTCCSIINN